MALQVWLLLVSLQSYDCTAVHGFTMRFGPPEPVRGRAGYGGKMSNVIDLYPDGFATPVYGGIAQSTDGGKTFRLLPISKSNTAGLFAGFVHYAGADGHAWAHDFGQATLLATNATRTSVSSNYTSNYKFENGTFTVQERAGPGVSFAGLPIPLCPAPRDLITFYAGGHMLLSDGTHLLTGELFWCAAPLPPGLTSLVAFRSKDGYHFEYAGNISTPLDIPGSSEGPNEHDCALLPNGDVLCVIRTGAGDGRGGYMPFYKTLSHDGGKTWSKPVAMPGMGCARPELLQLGNATILSAGRKMMNPEYDRGFDVWMSVDGGVTWEHRSGSYEHNAGRSRTGAPIWPETVNRTGDRWQFTSGYMGLVRVGESSAMVLYDTMWLPFKDQQESLEYHAYHASHQFGMKHSEPNLDYSFGLEDPEHNPPRSYGMRIDVIPSPPSPSCTIHIGHTLGCFNYSDWHGGSPGPVLPNYQAAQHRKLTLEACAIACHSGGFTIMGVQNGQDCFCGVAANLRTPEAAARSLPRAGCETVACSGDPAEKMCGGDGLTLAIDFRCDQSTSHDQDLAKVWQSSQLQPYLV